jgi:hypothetical protein
MFEFEVHQFQYIKIGVHVAQGLFIFVSWAIEIAVFKAKDSKIDGRPGWYFGLVCCLLLTFVIPTTALLAAT